MYEILDIYDKDRNRTGKTIERKEGNTLNKGEYIIWVQCWIINLSGKILMTQRKLSKKHGGMWECTVGCVKSGETSIEGIQREIKEEIGVDISENEFKLFRTNKEEREDVSGFRDIYVVNKDITLQDISFEDGEVINAKYVTIEEFKEMIEKGETFEWFTSFLNDYYKINGNKYLKVMFGNKSNANGYEYKIGETNIAEYWNPNELDPKKSGGFNISTEDKILRWLVRGDTIYDVIIPEDADIIDCPSESAPHGVFRTNKIILNNPRLVTDEMAMELYKKSKLPEKSYFKAMAGCCIREHMNTAKQIFKDKINKDNIDLAISEFEDFCNPKEGLGDNANEIYRMLKKFKELKIELRQLNVNFDRQEYEMLQSIEDNENGFSNPAYGISYEEYKEWLKKEDNYSKGKELPEEWIPCTTYFLYVNDIPVGYGRIRHSSNEYLENVIGAGNLGYGISKEYRGKGYGKILFGELLKKCREMGYNEIKLFPYKSNVTTVKIMQSYAGKIVGEFKDEKYIIVIPIEKKD